MSESPQPGEVLAGKYRIRRIIASGGMGSVYEAEHMGLDRVVAVKMLLPQAAASEEIIKRFRREAKIGAAIDSPHVAKVYDIEQLPDGRFIVVHEYLAGGSLRDRLRDRGAMKEPQTRTLLGQVCEGLRAAHDKGVVHRDLKPDNVVFEGDQPKLIDFGIARLTQQATQLTQEGQVLGTLVYMAPELFRGDEAGPPSDVYALGVMAYEMLSGVRPHSADTVPELLAKKLQEDVEPLADTVPHGVSPELSVLVHRMLDKEPTVRPSLEEVMRGLGQPQSTGTAVVGDRLPKPATGGAAIWIAIAAAALGAAIVIGVLFLTTSDDGEADPPETVASVEAEPPEPTPVAVDPAPAMVQDVVEAEADPEVEADADAEPEVDATAEAEAEPDAGEPEPDVVAAAEPSADAGPGAAPTRPPVRIISQPAGADVYLDGARVGATPFDLPTTGELPAVTLVLKAPDHQDRETGVQQMEYTLEEEPAEEEVEPEPAPAPKKPRRPRVKKPAKAPAPAPTKPEPKPAAPKKPGLAVD